MTFQFPGRRVGSLAATIDRFLRAGRGRTRLRDALNRFVRTHSFLSQVVAFTDAKLAQDYLRAVATKLERRQRVPTLVVVRQ